MRNIKTYNRYFSFILYEEDIDQMISMEYITKNYEYARILHDKDKTEDGEIKKPHYHIIIYVGKNPRNRKSIAKETKIQENYIEGCNKEKMLLYLLHYNNPEKTQYTIEEVDGELQKELIKIINKKTGNKEEQLEEIILQIYRNNMTLQELVTYCTTNNYYTILKENQYLLTRIIQERNYYNETKREKRRMEKEIK